jgi:hypothetical protein
MFSWKSIGSREESGRDGVGSRAATKLEMEAGWRWKQDGGGSRVEVEAEWSMVGFYGGWRPKLRVQTQSPVPLSLLTCYSL